MTLFLVFLALQRVLTFPEAGYADLTGHRVRPLELIRFQSSLS